MFLDTHKKKKKNIFKLAYHTPMPRCTRRSYALRSARSCGRMYEWQYFCTHFPVICVSQNRVRFLMKLIILAIPFRSLYAIFLQQFFTASISPPPPRKRRRSQLARTGGTRGATQRPRPRNTDLSITNVHATAHNSRTSTHLHGASIFKGNPADSSLSN